jgi:O-antigen ligase
VFWDPSVYGRFLVLAIAPSLVLIVFRRSLRVAVVAAAGVIVMWLGLLISFSQSSFAALLAVVICVAFLAWHWRALVAVGLTMVVLAGMLVAQPQIRRSVQHHTSSGLNQATSGRSDLVANGLRIAAHNPVLGVGVGGFKRAYADRVNLKGKDPKKAASHNTPVTVAAETGLVGLGLYAWLLAVLLLQAFRAPRSALRSIAGVGIVAIFVHSLFYNAFFEDPQAWGLLGLLAFASRVRARRVETDERRVVEQEAVPV